MQFKVVSCDPENTVGRVGRDTIIYCDGAVPADLRNLLPPELLAQLQYLPPGLQMLLLNTDALGNSDVYERLMELQDTLSNRRGMQSDVIDRIENIEYLEENQDENSQRTCMICLGEFEDGEQLKKLPCSHQFHCGCVEEWLKRSVECPICKHNVDRTLRQY